DDAGARAGHGRSLYGYTKLYGGARRAGGVPSGTPGELRADQGPRGPPDDRFVYLSDVLPTAWQAVEYAAIPEGGSVAVLGLGPIGDMSCRVALQRGAGIVIGVDIVPERIVRARRHGVNA